MSLSPEAIGDSATALEARNIRAALDVRERELGQKGGAWDEINARTMELILSHTPALLADCPVEILGPLRVAAAMMELWGTNTIRHFVNIEGEIDYRFSAAAIANMMHSHGCFLRELESLREKGFTQVSLLGTKDPDDCLACQEAHGAIFTIDSVPELPLAACRCETGYGCRVMVCAYLPDS